MPPVCRTPANAPPSPAPFWRRKWPYRSSFFQREEAFAFSPAVFVAERQYTAPSFLIRLPKIYLHHKLQAVSFPIYAHPRMLSFRAKAVGRWPPGVTRSNSCGASFYQRPAASGPTTGTPSSFLQLIHATTAGISLHSSHHDRKPPGTPCCSWCAIGMSPKDALIGCTEDTPSKTWLEIPWCWRWWSILSPCLRSGHWNRVA